MNIEVLIGETVEVLHWRHTDTNLNKINRKADCKQLTSKTSHLPVKRKAEGKIRRKSWRRTPSSLRVKRKNSSGGSSGPSSPQTTYSRGSYSEGSPSSSPVSPHRSQPRILVSSLLSEHVAVSYHLEVIQQPARAAEFRDAPLSRLPITPPVIVRLTVRDTSGNPVVLNGEIPFLIAHLSLFSENGQTRLDSGSSVPIGRTRPILYGNLVSSLANLEDLQGNKGLFFLFPDVSIRWRGRYQLGVTLLRISGGGGAAPSAALAETRTRTFDVLPREQYTASPQTRLTQTFIRQGARMFTFLPPTHPR